MKKLIGYAIVGSFFGGLFIATGLTAGWIPSTLIWSGCIAATALLAVGVKLITD